MKRFFSWILVLSILLALTVPAMAADDATGTTLRLEEANGTVTVKDAAGTEKTARAGMRLYNGYTIATGASSSAYISLDEAKAVKLDSSGKVEIKKSGKKLEVLLTSGQLYFNVTEPLKTDESLNIRTSTMVTGIRGSFGWVNLTQMGLMHGHVTLTCTNPETGETRVTEIYSGEKVSYEQAVSQEITADPELLEIDFVKEEIVIEDVPATVVEEIAKDDTLQAQLAEAEQAAMDVTELVESLEAKQAEEAAEEKAAQAEVEAAIAEQETAIAAAATEDTASGGTTTDGTTADYVDLSANTTTPTTNGGDSGGGGSGISSTPIIVTDVGELQDRVNDHSNVTYLGTESLSYLSVPATCTLTIGNSDGGYHLDVESLDNAGTIIVAETTTSNVLGLHWTTGGSGSNSGSIIVKNYAYVSTSGSSGTMTFANSGTITIEVSGGFYHNDGFMLTNTNRINNAGMYSLNGGTLTNRGTIDNSGAFVVNDGGTFDNYGTVNNTGTAG